MPMAYLVLGPESSGTRLTTDLLLRAGCLGASSHQQPFDAFDEAATPQVNQRLVETFRPPLSPVPAIVWRRSYPHRGEFCRPPALWQQLWTHGFDVHVVVCVRHWTAAKRSQLQTHGTQSELTQQYREIMTPLMTAECAWTMAVYESFVHGGLPAINSWLALLGLDPLLNLAGLDLRDENAKWFGQTQGQG